MSGCPRCFQIVPSWVVDKSSGQDGGFESICAHTLTQAGALILPHWQIGDEAVRWFRGKHTRVGSGSGVDLCDLGVELFLGEDSFGEERGG